MHTTTSFPTDWQLARLKDIQATPSGWIPAEVPGCVQRDWARDRGWPDPNCGQNIRLYDGLEDSAWLYRTKVPHDRELTAQDQRLVFLLGGVDHHAEVRLGGRQIADLTGMESRLEWDVTNDGGNTLEILLHPVPKRHGRPGDRSQASATTKPAVSYGWDWHPRFIPQGLTGTVGFFLCPAVRVTDADVRYELSEDFSCVRLWVTAQATPDAGALAWQLHDPEGICVLRGVVGECAVLSSPRLWWTHDHGEPTLYRLEIHSPDSPLPIWQMRIGFRRVRLVMPPDGWREPSRFPKSRSLPPITLELNGRPLFVKGTNLVPSDLCPSPVDNEPLINLAREAHFNLLRCWGGAAAPSSGFFQACDRIGILVWQEFPLACNLYPDSLEYLAELTAHALLLVRRVRRHPSLALWCGGNELFNSWSRMTDQSLALRHLNRICLEEDPGTPFLPTSPMEGMGHGDYRFLNEHGQDVFVTFQNASNTAYTEFGCPGPASVEAIQKMIPNDELWPPCPGGSWETHHGFGAWEQKHWLCLDVLEHYFGPCPDLETMVARGQWLQAEGYRGIYEEARRQWPQCSMALNWCFNEPWPCASNNSLLSWPHDPKPAYFTVSEACRPVIASARIPRFQWRCGDNFTAEIWMLNDTVRQLPQGEIEVSLREGERRLELLRWHHQDIGAQASLRGPSVHCSLPEVTTSDCFVLELIVQDHPERNSSYCLSLIPKSSPTSCAVPITPELNR